MPFQLYVHQIDFNDFCKLNGKTRLVQLLCKKSKASREDIQTVKFGNAKFVETFLQRARGTISHFLKKGVGDGSDTDTHLTDSDI